MLEPRPEIRMATRLRAMSICAPCLVSRSNAEAAGVGHARLAFRRGDKLAELHDAFALALENGRDLGGRTRFDHSDHTDAAVEGAQHFLLRYATGHGQPLEHRQH